MADLALLRGISTPSATRAKKLALDRDVIVSVLESSATRRDAKGYLQKYASRSTKTKSNIKVSRFVQDSKVHLEDGLPRPKRLINVAIVKLRMPHQLPQDILDGLAKTLSQLRTLGLLAVVILDCGVEKKRQMIQLEALRLCQAIDSSSGQAVAKLADNIFVRRKLDASKRISPTVSGGLRVDDLGLLSQALRRDMVVVVPSLARPDNLSSNQVTEAHGAVLALATYLSGKQATNEDEDTGDAGNTTNGQKYNESDLSNITSVERVILLDPLGGIPTPSQPNISHRFVNLAQEYHTLNDKLLNLQGSIGHAEEAKLTGLTHAANLSLARDALLLLPPSSSALITTPEAAANVRSNSFPGRSDATPTQSPFEFYGTITTRKLQNPLLHNLLTDRPVFSPSLPLQRLRDDQLRCIQSVNSSSATLIKRGMPVTVYPNPWASRWQPPRPGSRRLRLTDKRIDLPRLVYLIENSFGRKLDVDDYLHRIHNNLAGVIIAGEYEGGAILTWERPGNISDIEAFRSGRVVPYLDKFAVLKTCQGSAGVADIVFNTMVQDCLPSGGHAKCHVPTGRCFGQRWDWIPGIKCARTMKLFAELYNRHGQAIAMALWSRN
ncbi:hypothetical protein RJ55_06238 [Drechmeria coniospora]|nr:hypothetical protein RJ55_06238 [Drechmeria coniospora]